MVQFGVGLEVGFLVVVHKIVGNEKAGSSAKARCVKAMWGHGHSMWANDDDQALQRSGAGKFG